MAQKTARKFEFRARLHLLYHVNIFKIVVANNQSSYQSHHRMYESFLYFLIKIQKIVFVGFWVMQNKQCIKIPRMVHLVWYIHINRTITHTNHKTDQIHSLNAKRIYKMSCTNRNIRTIASDIKVPAVHRVIERNHFIVLFCCFLLCRIRSS